MLNHPTRLLTLPLLFAACAISTLSLAQAPAPKPIVDTPRTIKPDAEHPLLPIGTPAPDFSLRGIDDKTHTLSDYSGAKLLAIVFESNHCPVSENYEGRVRAIYKDYKDKGVQLVAVNPNNPKAVRLDELGYTDMTDSFDDMKLRAAFRHIDWPFLYDGDTQVLAQKFGAVATPHIFIFDQDRKLRYEGRIDDNQNQKEIKSHDARNALDALLAGQPVPVTHTPAFGCSTKWIAKSADVQAEMERIKNAPVKLDTATTDDLKKLRTNADSGKIVTLNFWSTQCKDCAATLTDLETTYRMYRGRQYDFVTVSTDRANRKDEVLKALQTQYASNTNLQLEAADMKAIQAAIGSNWKPNEPFTIVIGLKGEVLYQHAGPFSKYEMRRAVLTNMPDNKHYPGQQAYWSGAE